MKLLSTLFAGTAALSVPTATPRPTADVGVIGAGPAGLVLAHALRERGHSVRIFERRDSFRPVGAAVFMHPFALNSLRAVSPTLEKHLLDVCTTIHTLSFTTLAEDAPSFRLDTLGDAKRVLGAPFVAVRFWDMLRALRVGLPDELFCFGHQLERYEQHGDADGGVTLHFADAAQPPCTVRYLIDAGGIRSATRAQLLGDERIPRLRATFSVLPAERVAAAHEAVGGASTPGELGFVAGDNLSVVTMGLSDGGVMWSQTDLAADPTAPLYHDGSDAELRADLEAKYAEGSGWPSGVRALVEATTPADVIESTVAELPVAWRWGDGAVTLLGDAAHAQLPALGLGVSTAFGDVEELVVQLDRHGLSQKALRWYERCRMPACAALQLMSRSMYGLNKISANR